MRSRGEPSQRGIEVHIGRDTFQPPRFVPRTASPAADRIVSSLGPTGASVAHLPAPPTRILTSTIGARSRNCDELNSGCESRAARTAASASPNQRKPSRGNRARFDLSNGPAAFGIGYPRARAGSGRGKPITGEHEQRPPHGQMFDQRPVGI